MPGTSLRVPTLDSQHSQPEGILLSWRTIVLGLVGRHRNESARLQVPWRKRKEVKSHASSVFSCLVAVGYFKNCPGSPLISAVLTASRPSGSQGNHALVDQRMCWEHQLQHQYAAERQMPC